MQELKDWKPAPRRGTLVIKHVYIIDSQGEKQADVKIPSGENGRVLRFIAWLCRNGDSTTLADLKDLYVQATPKPEQPRHPDTGDVLTNKDGSPRTPDRRRDKAQIAASRLAGSGWITLHKNGDIRLLRNTPNEWAFTDPLAV